MLQNQPEDDSALPFKLPQIGRKQFEVNEVGEGCDRSSCDKGTTEELRRLQANPYLKKYAGLASKEKLKRDNSSSFLNIVSVKPIFRSSTRMASTKDANITLNQERSDKLIPPKKEEKWASE
jgi:hypothetical protein